MAVDNVSSIDELTYCPEMPEKPRNIVSIGTGGIVQGLPTTRPTSSRASP